MSEYFREPKKVRTRAELEKSCRMLREHNADLKHQLAESREAHGRLQDAVEQVIVDLDTQCTNAYATKMLRKALGAVK